MKGAFCPIRKCPLCGQLIRDPDFENPTGELCEGENPSSKVVGVHEVKLIGKGGVHYFKNAAFCLMTQNYPDSVHRVCILRQIQMWEIGLTTKIL